MTDEELIDALLIIAQRDAELRTLVIARLRGVSTDHRWLLWPSPFRLVTQPFGANPQLYARFGLPGHEGLDIRAPNGTPISAAADGTLTHVGRRSTSDPYGYHIRIQHKRPDAEYMTLYAHLTNDSSRAKKGDTVNQGQVIALADATGNVMPPGSAGAHLHFGLKRIGLQDAYHGYIDPLPFFVNPPGG